MAKSQITDEQAANGQAPKLEPCLEVAVVQYKDKDGVEGILPVYPSSAAIFAEVYCPVDLKIPKGTAGGIPLGIGFSVPEGYKATVHPSDKGLFYKGILAQYVMPGEASVPVTLPCINVSDKDVELKRGDAIGYVEISPVAKASNWSRRVSVQLHASPPPDEKEEDKEEYKEEEEVEEDEL